MLTLRKGTLVAFTMTAVAAVLGLGVYGYLSSATLEMGGALAAKVSAEQLLYTAVLLAIALVSLAFLLFRRGTRVARELDRILVLTQNGLTHPGEGLRRLGDLGARIALLVDRLSDLNRKRALKISGLSKLIDFLVDNMERNVLILDRRGEITRCSKKVLRQLGVEKGALAGRMASEVIAGLDYDDIVAELEKMRVPATRKGLEAEERRYSGDVIFAPIFNADDTLVSVVCLLEPGALVEEIEKTGEQVTAEEGTLGRRLLNGLRRQTKRETEKR